LKSPPFAFLILLVCVFSLLILVKFARCLSSLFIFQRTSFFFHWFFVCFFCLFVSISLISALIVIFFSSCACFGICLFLIF
jgi:hypothetical protein